MKFTALIMFFAIMMVGCQPKDNQQDSTSSEEAGMTTMTADNTLSEEEAKDGWTLLFDGESTEHWRGYNHETFPTKGWKVQDGELHVIFSGTEEDGFGGDIITKEQYDNFEFKLDFMLTDTANSGILYRVVEVENMAIWNNAPEYQLLDDKTYKDMGAVTDMQLTAANYDMHSTSGDYLKPMGEWNTAMIKIEGNTIEHWLNGNMTVSYEVGSEDWTERYKNSKFKNYEGYGLAEKGHIGIQDHGHTVKFKNIKVRSL